jgi:site-specific recombinase XerD
MPNLKVESTSPSAGLELLASDYIMACRARGLAYSTINGSYGDPVLGVFLPWCQSNGLICLADITPRRMDAFSVHLLEDPGRSGKVLAKASVHSYMRGIRGFLQWCADEGEGVAPKPSLPRLPRRMLDVFDRDEIDTLEAAADSERDRLMLRILGDCGLRSYELASLCPDQVIRDGHRAKLHIHGKGERDRFVPLPPSLLRRVERYVRLGRPKDAARDEIFLSLHRGRSGDYTPLTTSGVRQMVKRTAYRAGFEKRVYTHLMRHSFATNSLRDGMSPMLVAKIMGHNSLRMIERIYSHLTDQDAYDAMMEMYAKGEKRRRHLVA